MSSDTAGQRYSSVDQFVAPNVTDLSFLTGYDPFSGVSGLRTDSPCPVAWCVTDAEFLQYFPRRCLAVSTG
ncbi:hypothetical protein CYV19_00570 [Natronobacterium gregoryi SP2]|uniref:Uncharacterized protein n=1 Tax=Natronobacterium gregoryi (strain ATCC 43098 / DSM 3393 / CCM 3738 / CIP 104747 / IAM 13177 / JCM 8860 / NBRC 102187 / NCIMB 2189 / SP2) TaxID=797304 RepID=L9XPK4_NATGS|nr:hypothetical protein C490_15904 [Natronobacterium gregoryi SP2]PLK22201.1 hypothetical protein CYV19_00570 [Natronobacterium gregoryi SP2]